MVWYVVIITIVGTLTSALKLLPGTKQLAGIEHRFDSAVGPTLRSLILFARQKQNKTILLARGLIKIM